MSIHQPVLLQEVANHLKPLQGKTIIDSTFGGGGHSVYLAKHGAQVLAIDKDQNAIREGERLLQQIACPAIPVHGVAEHSFSFPSGGSLVLVQETYSRLVQIAASYQLSSVDAVLFDFGYSSDQLEQGRGFSFSEESFLDMRFDPEHQAVTAADLLKILSANQLENLFREYSQERHARLLARAIVKRREASPLTTTSELVGLIESIVPRNSHIHPATRVFQALRIVVNSEFEEINKGLEAGYNILKSGGKLLAISFHSGEDRIVKNFIRRNNLMANLLVPTVDECTANPRSRSAKLRIIEIPKKEI